MKSTIKLKIKKIPVSRMVRKIKGPEEVIHLARQTMFLVLFLLATGLNSPRAAQAHEGAGAGWLLSFSGSVLKWDQEGVEALGHNLELTNYLGPFGYWFSPEFAHQIPFLVRMNSAHVTILPVFALVSVGLHLYLLRIHGMSSQSGAPLAERQVPYSTHFKKMILYGTIAVGIIMVISAIVSAPLSTLGNPKIEVTKPDWYMLWVYAIEDLGGLQVVPYILAPAIIIMLFVPFIDRNPETRPAKRKLMMALLVAALLLYVGMTVFAAMSPPQSHLGMMK